MRLIRNFMIFMVFSLTALGVSAQEASKDNSKEVTCLHENFDWSSVDNPTYLNNPKLVIVNPGEGPKFPVQMKHKPSKGTLQFNSVVDKFGYEFNLDFKYEITPNKSRNKAKIEMSLIEVDFIIDTNSVNEAQMKEIKSQMESLEELENNSYSYILTEAGKFIEFKKTTGEINDYDQMIDFSQANITLPLVFPKQYLAKNLIWHALAKVEKEVFPYGNAYTRYCNVGTVKELDDKRIKLAFVTRINSMDEYKVSGEIKITASQAINLENNAIESNTILIINGVKVKGKMTLTPDP